jgi:hypothetical protein
LALEDVGIGLAIAGERSVPRRDAFGHEDDERLGVAAPVPPTW